MAPRARHSLFLVGMRPKWQEAAQEGCQHCGQSASVPFQASLSESGRTTINSPSSEGLGVGAEITPGHSARPWAALSKGSHFSFLACLFVFFSFMGRRRRGGFLTSYAQWSLENSAVLRIEVGFYVCQTSLKPTELCALLQGRSSTLGEASSLLSVGLGVEGLNGSVGLEPQNVAATLFARALGWASPSWRVAA